MPNVALSRLGFEGAIRHDALNQRQDRRLEIMLDTSPSPDADEPRGLTSRESLAFLALVLILAWAFGTFERFPFDDEVFDLTIIKRFSLIDLVGALLRGYDVHPPLSYTVFKLMAVLHLPIWAMRLCSLLMTASAFLLVLDLTLRRLTTPAPMARVTTLFLFLTFPLLYGTGDAVRWYPLFAVLVAGFVWLDLQRDAPTVAGGVLLGLAASTNYLAVIPYAAFAVRRYAIGRRFALRSDAPFHLVLALFSVPGIVTFLSLRSELAAEGVANPHLEMVPFAKGLVGLAQSLMGFFGGYRLGIPDLGLALPYLALFTLSLAALILDRGHKAPSPATPKTARDLMIATSVMALLCILYTLPTGHQSGRAFLFVAPFLLGCFAIGFWRAFEGKRAWLMLGLASFILFGGALANARWSDAPFKRNLAIPFDAVLQFVADNTHGRVLYISNEDVSRYLLKPGGLCIMGPAGPPPCLKDGIERFDDIVLGIDQNFDELPGVGPIVAEVRAHRALKARGRFGHDASAAFKSRLTGQHLDPWILTLDIYH